MKEFPPFRLDTVNQRKQRIGWTPPRARPRHGSRAGEFSGGPRTPSRHVPLGAVREEHPRQRRADYEADAAALVRSSGSPDAGDRNGMLWSPVPVTESTASRSGHRSRTSREKSVGSRRAYAFGPFPQKASPRTPADAIDRP